MQFLFSFKHMETSPALQTYAEQKLGDKIDKFVAKPTSAHIIFKVVRHEQTAQISLKAGDGFDVDITHTSSDMYASIDQLADKLSTQLKKHKEKLKDHKQPKLSRSQAEEDEEEAETLDAGDIVKFEASRRRAQGA